MASITLRVSEKFPVGTSLGAYPDVGWLETHPPPFAAPTATGTVQADGTVTFANLNPSLSYRAGADMGGGIWRYVGFVTPPSATGGQSREPASTDAVVYVSSNAGDDSNDGLSEGTAKATIAAAIAAIPVGVSGRVRFLPGSTHTISAQISLRSDLTLDLNDASIQRAAGYGGDLFSAPAPVSRVKIQDGRFENAGSSATGFDMPNGSSEIVFRRNRVSNHASAFFNCGTGAGLNKNIRVVANDFYGVFTAENQNTVTVWNPYNVRILNNYFEGTGGCNASTSQAVASTCRHVHIKGNTFVDLNGSAIFARTSGNTTLEDVVISGNTGERMGDTLHVKGLIVAGEAVVTGTPGTTRRVTIYGNTIKDFWGVGISCGGGQDGPTVQDFVIAKNEIDAAPVDAPVDTTRGSIGIQLSGVQGFSMASNTIRNTGRGGIRLLAGSNFAGSKRGSIGFNTVIGCCANPNVTAPNADEEAGILLWQTSSDIEIIGNVVRNMSTVQNGGTGIGLADYADITGITIALNRCFDDRTPKLQEYGVRIGESTADANQPSDIIVTNNDLRGNLTAGIKRYETTDHNNVFFNNKGTMVGSTGATAADALLKRLLTATASLDFPSVPANGQASLTITSNGSTPGDAVFASPDTTLEAGLSWNAWVSAANTVTIRLTNTTAGAIDPAARTWRVTTLKF